MKPLLSTITYLSLVILFSYCTSTTEQQSNYETVGSIEVLDDRLNAIIDAEAPIEVLAEGFSWSEGPVWSEELKGLLFSDVPENKIYLWNENGTEVFLTPSGHTEGMPHSNEPGSNGLFIDDSGRLMVCQHGDRRLAYTPLQNTNAGFETIIDNYNGMRFSSPNDLDLTGNGEIYFTDPPYGLASQDNDSMKETPFNGVYKLNQSTGALTLIDSTLTRPNGVALTSDNRFLVVANSDSENPVWRTYDLTSSDLAYEQLFDATTLSQERSGLPDGLKINSSGIVFATGPGGVLIMTLQGEHLGTILTTRNTANCAFSPDEKTLYITADDLLLRVALK